MRAPVLAARRCSLAACAGGVPVDHQVVVPGGRFDAVQGEARLTVRTFARGRRQRGRRRHLRRGLEPLLRRARHAGAARGAELRAAVAGADRDLPRRRALRQRVASRSSPAGSRRRATGAIPAPYWRPSPGAGAGTTRSGLSGLGLSGPSGDPALGGLEVDADRQHRRCPGRTFES